MIEERSIEVLTDRIGRELLQRIEAARPKDYRERLEADPLVVWSRGGPRFLSDVLRFVDVFPAIRSDAELMEYLAAYVGDPKRILVGAGAQTDDVPKAVRALVENLKARFVAGETIAEAVRAMPRAAPRALRVHARPPRRGGDQRAGGGTVPGRVPGAHPRRVAGGGRLARHTAGGRARHSRVRRASPPHGRQASRSAHRRTGAATAASPG